MVLRQPRRAPVRWRRRPRSVLQEARVVLTGLRNAGVPLPNVLGVCLDAAVVVAYHFYAMDCVEGGVARTPARRRVDGD